MFLLVTFYGNTNKLPSTIHQMHNVKQYIHQSIFALNSKNKGSTLFRPKILFGFCVARINLTYIVQHGY